MFLLCYCCRSCVVYVFCVPVVLFCVVVIVVSLSTQLYSPQVATSTSPPVQTIQKQLGSHLSNKTAVVKAGRQLMKQKTGEDKAVLKKKLQNLEKEWEKVCQVSVDRQDRLDDAYMKIGQFRYSYVVEVWLRMLWGVVDLVLPPPPPC